MADAPTFFPIPQRTLLSIIDPSTECFELGKETNHKPPNNLRENIEGDLGLKLRPSKKFIKNERGVLINFNDFGLLIVLFVK